MEPPKGYRYKITVEGTDIEEWYQFEEELEEHEVKQIWLDDVRDNRALGQRLAKQWKQYTQVEALWKTHSGQQGKDKGKKAVEGTDESLVADDEEM